MAAIEFLDELHNIFLVRPTETSWNRDIIVFFDILFKVSQTEFF